MTEYFTGVVLVVLAGSVGTYLCHERMKGVTKIACQLVLLLAVSAPIGGLISNIAGGGIRLPDFSVGDDVGAYEEIARDAFADGVSLAIQSEYGLSEEEVYVGCDGFDFETMKAERIYVTLMGRGALSDHKAIKKYVEQSFGGVCVVEIELG